MLPPCSATAGCLVAAPAAATASTQAAGCDQLCRRAVRGMHLCAAAAWAWRRAGQTGPAPAASGKDQGSAQHTARPDCTKDKAGQRQDMQQHRSHTVEEVALARAIGADCSTRWLSVLLSWLQGWGCMRQASGLWQGCSGRCSHPCWRSPGEVACAPTTLILRLKGSAMVWSL